MNKLIIFKWASLLLSVGCISFFIVSDVYGDNNVNIEEVPQEEIQEEVESSVCDIDSASACMDEDLEEAVAIVQPLPVQNPSHEPEEKEDLSNCKGIINAYNKQIASDNGKVSETIVEKYEACTDTKTVETTTPVETAPVIPEKKVKETKLVKEKKK